jgi:hypothetical protein
VSFFFLAALERTISVPRILVSIVRTGLSMIWKTPTDAARWMTTSAWSMSSAASEVLKIVSTVRRKRGLALSSATLSTAPVERSSRTRTSCPSARSLSERCDPMKPAPPVMR